MNPNPNQGVDVEEWLISGPGRGSIDDELRPDAVMQATSRILSLPQPAATHRNAPQRAATNDLARHLASSPRPDFGRSLVGRTLRVSTLAWSVGPASFVFQTQTAGAEKTVEINTGSTRRLPISKVALCWIQTETETETDQRLTRPLSSHCITSFSTGFS